VDGDIVQLTVSDEVRHIDMPERAEISLTANYYIHVSRFSTRTIDHYATRVHEEQ
jgi:hypothetical protein